MNNFFLTLIITTASLIGFSQVKSGEKLIFSGAYNMSGIMTPLAQITMTTGTTTTAKSTYLHLSCEASTYSKWDSFFKIRDLYESYVNPSNFMPSLYKRSINEGGYTKTEKYVFKGTNVTSTSKRKNKPETVKNFKVGSSTQDVVSMIYKLRTLELATMKLGQTKSFMLVFDENEIPVTVKFMGTETVNAGNLGAKNCYKLAIAAKTNALKGADKNLIWLTADANKIPALIKFSIKVGVGQLTLTSAAGI
ncbi:MAG: DUF3108 domain-containing protein [Flavobacterium sp.]|nr:DUF3108 domain-containing protein [Flavobacterium sp.]